ncbi:MAG: TIR domain-containing protein [Candidatus Thiodiazotropha sp. L084R]
MSKPAAYISLKRNKTNSYQLRQFAITIDNTVVGKIKSGETKQFKVPSGTHAISVKIDLYKSQPLQIELKPEQTFDLECGDRSPESIKEAFTLKGIEKSLSSLINPKQYLYVQALDYSAPQMTPHKPKPRVKPPQETQTVRKSCTVFISYRRDDSREITGRICDRLNSEFGKQTIFRDVDSIPAGVDFRKHINKTIDQCSMLVAIIGDKWLDAKNRKGERRLDLPNDHLRVEIETALKKEVPVIPVLVKNGVMPDEEELPEGLKSLAYRNAIPIPEEPFFHNGVDLLIKEMSKGFSPSKPVRQSNRNAFCIYCGNEIMPGNKFCIQCGKPV